MKYNGATIAITGPTASGKTRKAVALAAELNGEIISADSRQVYRGMDIGTGKDLDDYKIPYRKTIPCHLIDIRPAGYHYNLQEFLCDYDMAQTNIREKGKIPIVCGGTGMYIENALNGVKMEVIPKNQKLREDLKNKSLSQLTDILGSMKKLHNTTDTDTRERALRGIEIEDYYLRHPEANLQRNRKHLTPPPYVLIALDIDRDRRRQLISERLRKRLEEGLIEEVERLLAEGVSAESLIYYGLEYKYVTKFLIGEMQKDEMVRNLETAIHQFAKRQMTWIRGMERRSFRINWMPADMPDEEFVRTARGLLKDSNNA